MISFVNPLVLRLIPVSLLLGAGAVAFFHALPSFLLLFAILIFSGFGIVFVNAICARKGFISSKWLACLRPIGLISCLIFSAGVGGLLSVLHISSLLEKQLPHELDAELFQLEFEIVQFHASQSSTRFDARIVALTCVKESACADFHTWREKIVDERIRLSWYRAPSLQLHDVWRVNVVLKRPRGMVNPRGFDYHAWLLQHNIFATGSVRKEGAQKVSSFHSTQDIRLEPFHLLSVEGLRKIIEYRVFSHDENNGYSRFFRALLLGDTRYLSTNDWEVFKRTGTIHLMAISGLHIGLIAGLGFWLGGLLTRLCNIAFCIFAPRVPTRQCLRIFSSPLFLSVTPVVLAIAFAFFYALLAGFSIPTQRAFLAVLFVGILSLSGMKVSRYGILAWVACIVVLIEPLAWLSAGYWLSFMAVVCLIYTFGARPRLRSKLITLVKMQIVLSLGLCIPLILLGQPVSLSSPLANLVAVPVVSFVVVPGVFLIAIVSMLPGLSQGQFLLDILSGVFDFLWRCLSYLSSVDGIYWWPHTIMSNGFITITCVLGMLALLSPKGLGLRLLGGLCLVVVLTAPRGNGHFQLTVLDVGQGLSAVFQAPEYDLVYDTGPRFSSTFEAGSRIVWPYLISQGIQSIDLIVSHGDHDHSGGAQALSENIPVNHYRYGETFPLGNVGDSMVTTPCRAGDQWEQGGAQFSVLWPEYDGYGPKKRSIKPNSNNQSCVVLIEANGVTVLLTGDIDKTVEKILMDAGRLPRKVDVLIAPHHGSRTSSSQQFIQTVNPTYVIYNAGFKNRYRHPHPTVTERYESLGVEALSTAKDGAITIRWPVDENPVLEIQRERIDRPRLWY